MRDDVYKQRLTNQPSWLRGKTDLDGNIMKTSVPFEGIEAIEKYFGAIDEHYDECSLINQEAHILIETDGKIFNNSNGVIMVREVTKLT